MSLNFTVVVFANFDNMLMSEELLQQDVKHLVNNKTIEEKRERFTV